MPRVVPSQVVAVIDRLFRGAENARDFALHKGLSNHAAAVVDLVDRVPDNLIRLQTEDFANLRMSVAAIRNQIDEWRIRDSMFGGIAGLPAHPIAVIRACMSKCPDEASAPDTTELLFVTDEELRESIRLDISSAYADLTDRNWKGATVLAASAVEALLLWALQEHEKKNTGAIGGVIAALQPKTLSKSLGTDLEAQGWHLHEYVAVAAHLGILKPDTASQVRLAKDARNLVHPGRAARLKQKCDRGTALTALAAVGAVVRDLTLP